LIALYLHSIICYANAECDLPSARRRPRVLFHTRHALPLPMISLPLLPGSLEPDGSVPYSFSFCFLVFWSLVGLRFLGLLVSLLGCDQINWLVCICNVRIHNTYLGLAPLLGHLAVTHDGLPLGPALLIMSLACIILTIRALD